MLKSELLFKENLCQARVDEYQLQLAEKQDIALKKLEPFLTEEAKFEIFCSEPKHYRNRVEFRIWHEKTRSYYAMFSKKDQAYVEIKQCSIAQLAIYNLMQPLLKRLSSDKITIYRLYQIEFLCSSDQAAVLVSLIYKKSITEELITKIQQIERELNIFIVLRARKQKYAKQDYIIEKLQLPTLSFEAKRNFSYKVQENVFHQPNSLINSKMINWGLEVLNRNLCGNNIIDNKCDLLDLYCGNGNFTLPMAQIFRNVLGIELDKRGVKAGQWAIANNKVKNANIIRSSTEKISTLFLKQHSENVITKPETFNISLQSNISDQKLNYEFNAIIVDPPRMGLDKQTIELAKKFKYILYYSCNIDSLVSNLAEFKKDYNIKEFALFDQFPYTSHIEMGIFLVSK